MKHAMKGKTLKDPVFAGKVREQMLQALLAAGIITDPNDPRIKGPPPMTAQQAAKMLAAAGIDPSTIKDPRIRAAVKLASAIATGDPDAIKKLAMHSSGEHSAARSALIN